MELRDYVKVLRKQWLIILLCVALTVAAALIITVRTTPKYRTGVTFFVSTPAQSADASSAYTGGLFSQQRVKSYAQVVAGPSTAARIAQGLGVDRGFVAGAISAAAVPDTVLLNVTVTSTARATSLRIARQVAIDFPQIVEELERPPTGGRSPIRASVTEQPQLAGSAFTPRPVRNLSVAFVLGLLLGVGLAVAREALDNTVKNPDDILAGAGTATLGAITFDPSAGKRPLIVHDKPRAARAEAFRQLRTNLQFIAIDKPLRSFVLTSSVPSEGKSTMACNLAITLAQAGIRVCLVEGDLRRPRVAEYLGLEGAVGVTNVVIGKVTADDALQPWGDGRLSVLASGPLPPNPSELLASRGMHTLIDDLQSRFDIVIIDAPPLLPVTDAAILATMTDGAVLAVRCRSTKKEQLHRATEALRAVDATILGSVLNMVPRRGPDAYYSYGYGYGYGYGGHGYSSYESDRKKPRLSREEAELVTRPLAPVVGTPAVSTPVEPPLSTVLPVPAPPWPSAVPASPERPSWPDDFAPARGNVAVPPAQPPAEPEHDRLANPSDNQPAGSTAVPASPERPSWTAHVASALGNVAVPPAQPPAESDDDRPSNSRDNQPDGPTAVPASPEGPSWRADLVPAPWNVAAPPAEPRAESDHDRLSNSGDNQTAGPPAVPASPEPPLGTAHVASALGNTAVPLAQPPAESDDDRLSSSGDNPPAHYWPEH